ncbi:MAG: ribose 5-phosphate isomerase B [Armatimonadota bacterium]
MKIAIGSDHAGLNLKRAIKEALAGAGHEVRDFGTDSEASVDYPDYVFPVAEAVARGEVDLAIFPCGSGLGPVIAANKVPGVRAVVCHDVYSARSSRRDNDANMLTMGERVIGIGAALEVVNAWVNEPFSGVDRHQRRVDKITAAEKRYCGGQ